MRCLPTLAGPHHLKHHLCEESSVGEPFLTPSTNPLPCPLRALRVAGRGQPTIRVPCASRIMYGTSPGPRHLPDRATQPPAVHRTLTASLISDCHPGGDTYIHTHITPPTRTTREDRSKASTASRINFIFLATTLSCTTKC